MRRNSSWTLAALLVGAVTLPAIAQEGRREKTREREKDKQRVSAPAQVGKGKPVAQRAAQFERSYRHHVARLDRLEEIFRRKNDESKLAKVTELRARLEKRYANAMDGYRRDLGRDHWARLEKQVPGLGRGGKAGRR